MQTRILRTLLLATTVASASNLRGQAPTPAPPPTPISASPLTLPQIVARQQANYDRIQTAQGQVVWSQTGAASGQTTSPVSEKRIIHFALEPNRNVTLVLPAGEWGKYVANQGRVDWSKVISAAAIDGDTVYSISQPEGTSTPEVHVRLLTPDMLEQNPLLKFHPRQLGEERIKQSSVAGLTTPAAAPRPQVSEVSHQGRQALRVDLANPAAPEETLYYILDPSRGYLPMEIGRLRQGRPVSRSTIVIGHTKDGTWVPAKRETVTLDEAGQVAGRENWHYQYLSVNEGLSRKGATLSFFHLPEATRFFDPTGQRLPSPSPL